MPSARVLTVSLDLHLRLALIPASVMRFGGKHMRLKVLPVKISSPPVAVGFVTVKDRTLTPLAERFIACTRKVADKDTGRGSTRCP